MKRGFTLIELLTVISILAILAALLFPVFSRAKQAAKSSTTLSNVSQLGKATLLYAIDYDDTMPMVTEGRYGEGRVGGWNFYSEFGSRGSGRFDASRGSLWPYVKSREVYRSGLDGQAAVSGNSFAMNGCLADPTQGAGLLPGRPLSVSPSPSAQMMFGEEQSGEGGTNDGFFHPRVDALAEWHTGRNAFVFVDGHTKLTATRGRYPEIVDASERSCWDSDPLTGG